MCTGRPFSFYDQLGRVVPDQLRAFCADRPHHVRCASLSHTRPHDGALASPGSLHHSRSSAGSSFDGTRHSACPRESWKCTPSCARYTPHHARDGNQQPADFPDVRAVVPKRAQQGPGSEALWLRDGTVHVVQGGGDHLLRLSLHADRRRTVRWLGWLISLMREKWRSHRCVCRVSCVVCIHQTNATNTAGGHQHRAQPAAGIRVVCSRNRFVRVLIAHHVTTTASAVAERAA